MSVYEQLARIGKALGSAGRVHLLELLCQGERSVETLATAAGMGLTNTSQHLQILRAARLVETRREGTKIFYRVADDAVCRFFLELGDLARARLAEVEQFVQSYVAGDGFDEVSREELLERLDDCTVVVLDVRPTEEFLAGHIPGAISVPPETVTDILDALPVDAEIVAYCRGPYCVLASHAIEFLREHGFQARRLEDGFPEWRVAGLPVAVSEQAP